MKITHVKPIVENSKNLAIEVGSRVKTPDGTGTVRHIEAMEGYDVKSLKRHDDIICFVDLDSGKLEFYMINEVQPITQPGQYVFPEPKGMMEDDVTEVTPALQPGSKIRTKKAGMEGEVAKIENGIVFFQLGDGRMMKTSESNVVPVEKLEDGEFEEGLDWRGTHDGSDEARNGDHTFDDATAYIQTNYPFKKKYTVRRAEPGFRAGAIAKNGLTDPEAFEKEFKKSILHMQGVNGAIDHLGLEKNAMMSGSYQATRSIGFSWMIYENKGNGIGVLYYQDRGMGSDQITIAAKDKKNLEGAIQVFRDAGAISDPAEMARVKAEKSKKRNDVLSKKNIKIGSTIKSQYGTFKVVGIMPSGRIKLQDVETGEVVSWSPSSIKAKDVQEGSMGGFNRCAPSSDVSYEKVLDEVIGAWEDANQPEQERRAGPKPEPVPGLNRPKAEKIANAMEIRLNDTIYVYKLVKGMISLEEVPPAVRMAIYKLVDGMPTDQSGALKPFVMDKLRQVVAESRIQEEVERLSGLYEKEGPCWKGYKQVGMKKKGGKKVPNCVPNK